MLTGKTISWSSTNGAIAAVSATTGLVTAMSAVGFVNLTGGNYRLSTTSPYRNAASDGADIGCNVDTLNVVAGIKY